MSKHYNGKSQSFTSLSNVRSLEDMAKPENPYNKKLKSCKSYGVFLEGFKSSDNLQPPIRSSSSSRLNSKRGSCSSLRAKRNGSFLGNNSRPPAPPNGSTSFTSQTPLFVWWFLSILFWKGLTKCIYFAIVIVSFFCMATQYTPLVLVVWDYIWYVCVVFCVLRWIMSVYIKAWLNPNSR